MRYTVYAMGVEYASFNQELDAQEWAKFKSKEFNQCWWEIRRVSNPALFIAYCNGVAVYGAENEITIG